jgi:hypothetical protein
VIAQQFCDHGEAGSGLCSDQSVTIMAQLAVLIRRDLMAMVLRG